MKARNRAKLCGFTLMELIVTTSMLAITATATMVLIRTSYNGWSRHAEDLERRSVGLAVLQHVTRHVRQAQQVVNVSAGTNPSGTLSLLDPQGQTLVWQHNAATNQVFFGIDSPANSLLANDVTELRFSAVDETGTTTTTELEKIRSIVCTTKVELSRPTGIQEVENTCRAWLRSW